MTAIFNATCRSCGHRFIGERGGGFSYLLLHCQNCGEAKKVPTADVIGLSGRLQEVSTRISEVVRNLAEKDLAAGKEGPEVAQLRDEYQLAAGDFDDAVAAVIDSCRCGGMYSLVADIRCPACRSAKVSDEPPFMYAD